MAVTVQLKYQDLSESLQLKGDCFVRVTPKVIMSLHGRPYKLRWHGELTVSLSLSLGSLGLHGQSRSRHVKNVLCRSKVLACGGLITQGENLC